MPVHCDVKLIGSMSAHADSTEILRWLGGFTRAPQSTFIVHGEPEAMEALSTQIANRLKWRTKMPEHRETIELK